MERISSARLNYYIHNGQMSNLLTGKKGAKLNIPNGDELNLEPQDYVGVIKELYNLYNNGNRNISIEFENSLMKLSKGDLIDLYSAIKLIIIQINYELRKKSPFELTRKVEILNNIKSNLLNYKNELEEKKWEGIYFENGIFGAVQQQNEWLKRNDLPEIIDHKIL